MLSAIGRQSLTSFVVLISSAVKVWTPFEKRSFQAEVVLWREKFVIKIFTKSIHKEEKNLQNAILWQLTIFQLAGYVLELLAVSQPCLEVFYVFYFPSIQVYNYIFQLQVFLELC